MLQKVSWQLNLTFILFEIMILLGKEIGIYEVGFGLI